MDPNATLREMRRLVPGLQKYSDTMGPLEHEVWRFVDLFDALDEWISRGGFLPQDWQKGR